MKRSMKILVFILALGLLLAALPLQGLAAPFDAIFGAGESFLRDAADAIQDGVDTLRDGVDTIRGSVDVGQVKDSLASGLERASNAAQEAVNGAAALLKPAPSPALPDIRKYLGGLVPASVSARLAKPAADAEKWLTGYGQQLLEGAGELGDLLVRTVAVDDGRGTVLFSVIDGAGVTNADLRAVRAALADYAAENGLVSISVSMADTPAIGTARGLVGQLRGSFLPSIWGILTKGLDSIGFDPDYAAKLAGQAVKSAELALDAMAEGAVIPADFLPTMEKLVNEACSRFVALQGALPDIRRAVFEYAPLREIIPVLRGWWEQL